MSPNPSSPGPIDGIWELVRAELDGEQAPELVTTKTVLTLANGAYEVRFAGEIADRGTFEAGTTPDDKTILLRGTEGQNAGRTILGIYQLVGERLRVCYGLSGVAPAAFTTATGTERYLATYRRKLS